jgi:hypothetical protein
MEGAALFGGLTGIFLFITAVMAFFIPFFIFRIRNEVIKMNKHIKTGNAYLAQIAANAGQAAQGARQGGETAAAWREADKNGPGREAQGARQTEDREDVECYMCKKKVPENVTKSINGQDICIPCCDENNL